MGGGEFDMISPKIFLTIINEANFKKYFAPAIKDFLNDLKSGKIINWFYELSKGYFMSLL